MPRIAGLSATLLALPRRNHGHAAENVLALWVDKTGPRLPEQRCTYLKSSSTDEQIQKSSII